MQSRGCLVDSIIGCHGSVISSLPTKLSVGYGLSEVLCEDYLVPLAGLCHGRESGIGSRRLVIVVRYVGHGCEGVGRAEFCDGPVGRSTADAAVG